MCDLHACVRTVGILFNTHTHKNVHNYNEKKNYFTTTTTTPYVLATNLFAPFSFLIFHFFM